MGAGEDKEKLFKLARNLGLEERVIFHDYVTHASKYIPLFDIFYLPSRTEALAYVALEALNTQIPIISHNVGGLPEILTHEPLTYLLDHKSKHYENDLRNAIHKALKEKAVRQTDKYLKDEMVNRTKNLYLQ